MTAARDEVLARYGPIREAIKRVLGLAQGSCAKADWTRAMRRVAPWADTAALAESDEAAGMVIDVALFERNNRGRRAFDRFMAGKAQGLPAPDLALARRMADTAAFSVFRYAGRHEAAGVWLEDMLRRPRRVWLVDRSLEKNEFPEGLVIAMRTFEAEAFHAGFGVVAVVDPDLYEMLIDCAERGQSLPIRHSLAATLYGDALADEGLPMNHATAEMMEEVLDRLEGERPAVFWTPEDGKRGEKG